MSEMAPEPTPVTRVARDLTTAPEKWKQRFWRKVTKTDTCWLWNGTKSDDGYGYQDLPADGGPRRRMVAHKIAFLMLVADIPEGLQLDHLCRVRSCVNPDHLEPVTCWENVMRGFGLAAINARSTHCKRGHEFSPENLLSVKDGTRRCAACQRRRWHEWKRRQKGIA